MKVGWKLSLGARLSLTYLIVTLIGMGIAAPLAWLAVEQLYLETQSANLLAQAKLAAAALRLQTAPVTGTTPYNQSSNVTPGIHTRLIDVQGAALIDLSLPGQPSASSGLTLPDLAQNAARLVTPQELLSRPEIAQAQLGQPATAIRRVDVAGGKRVLYAAAPVLGGDGTVVQIVYLATPLPDTQWDALPPALRAQLSGAILAAVFLSSLAGLFIARRISQPLNRLVQAAQAVGGGDLGWKAPEDPAIAELAVLGRAFNGMTASLRQSEQAKTAFISDISHELRTPLTVIKGTIETLQDGALDDMHARGPFLASMSQETERLIRLVNDLLVLTRADAGVLNLLLSPLDLAEVARARCAILAPAASQRQVILKVVQRPTESGQPVCLVLADADRLAQVLDNLLDNAIRYSPPGGEVVVSVGKEEERVVCRISDKGVGIPENHLPFIFERFYRADPARQRDQGGSGLGLAIVRSLVRAQGGEVAVTSQVSQGTTFTFWLPVMHSQSV